MAPDLIRMDKQSVSPDSAIVVSEQIKDVISHLIHLVGYFDYYCQIQELFPIFGKEKFQNDIFLRSLSPINV